MARLVFVEGVSGVGKSTMVRALTGELRRMGKNVRAYVEFDFENPIDFYCTAYIPAGEFERLCGEHPAHAAKLRASAIPAGEAYLVRYYNEDEPLYEQPLLGQLAQMEFCYHPAHLVPPQKYTAAYKEVWKQFANALRGDEIVLFDGSLLHHPINDMMRNYHADAEQALGHVRALLESLGNAERFVFYMFSADLAAQLQAARRDRGQSAADDDQIRFWTKRRETDLAVLGALNEVCEFFDVSDNGWQSAKERMLSLLL